MRVMNGNTDKIREVPAFAALLDEADHVDVKIIEGEATLREFLAGFINYHPAWMRFLYGVRMVFVRFLGMRQDGIPSQPNLKPEDISFMPGDRLAFFRVDAGEEDRYFICSAKESHLTAYLGVMAEPVTAGRNRFHVVTVVHYNRWTGPVYFNVIRPFHHVVVGRMAQAGVSGA